MWIKTDIIFPDHKAILFIDDKDLDVEFLKTLKGSPEEIALAVIDFINTTCPRLQNFVLLGMFYDASWQRMKFVVSHPTIPPAKFGEMLPEFNLLEVAAGAKMS